MKNVTLYALLLSFFCTTLYPLTDSDWRVIKTLHIGSAATGSGLGTMIGLGMIKIRTQLGATKGRITLSIGSTAGGAAVGSLYGQFFAAHYIARKYGVSPAEAWNAIKNNLDLSTKLKK